LYAGEACAVMTGIVQSGASVDATVHEWYIPTTMHHQRNNFKTRKATLKWFIGVLESCAPWGRSDCRIQLYVSVMRTCNYMSIGM